MAHHMRTITFSEAYADPAADDEDELLDTLTDAILRLLYGRTPDDLADRP
jgi:hypothetical protein